MNVPCGKEAIGELFNKVAPIYGTVGPETFVLFGNALVNAAAILPGCRILDLACGRGAVLFPAAELAGPTGSAVGIDISRSMVDHLNREIAGRGCSTIETVVMDAENLHFDDNSFDYVLCGFGIFFCPNPILALKEALRVLKASGIIAISTWEGMEMRRKTICDALAALPYAINAKEATRMLPKGFDSEGEIRKNLAIAGFSDISVRVETGIFFYRDEEEWWSAQWSHGIRSVLESIEKQAGKDALYRYKQMVFQSLQKNREAEGIRQEMRALITVGKK